MYRKRRKIQSYHGTSRGRFGGHFKFVVVAVIALAVASALITGSVLGKNASKSKLDSFGRHNLTDFGGVKEPAEDYTALADVQASYVNAAGVDRSDFKRGVNDAADGNAIAFKANDGAGNIFFSAEVISKAVTSMTAFSTVTAEEIADAINGERKISVAYFYSTAFTWEDNGLRILKIAEELAIISELASMGIDEIVIFGLPDDSDYSRSVTAYMASVEAECETANICVALSESNMNGSGASRVISATEGYADAYAIDMSAVTGEQLGNMIEKCAYFITNYNMRLVLASSEGEARAELLALLESYGIDSYMFVG